MQELRTHFHLVVLSGLPGAGKTALADRLRDELGYFVLSRDAVKRSLFGLLDFGTEQNSIAFTAMCQALPVLLRSGASVVLDGMPFARQGETEVVQEIAERSGAKCRVLFLDCPVHVASVRLSTADSNGPADRTPDLPVRIASEFRPIPADWRRIDATRSLDDVFIVAAGHLGVTP